MKIPIILQQFRSHIRLHHILLLHRNHNSTPDDTPVRHLIETFYFYMIVKAPIPLISILFDAYKFPIRNTPR